MYMFYNYVQLFLHIYIFRTQGRGLVGDSLGIEVVFRAMGVKSGLCSRWSFFFDD